MMNGPTLARTEGPTALQRYSATASSSARVVITRYSTSFSLACRMLGSPAREHISNVYALVRLADEVVDGVAREAGLKAQEVAAALEQLEAETEAALASGYSTNMIVHAFACTARSQGITTELTRPFFASMRSDLLVTRHDDATLQGYIYGSAEVVGLMCLAVFRCMPDAPAGHEAQTETAARRLGAAFQKVNFLRDLATDTSELGRSYFPDWTPRPSPTSTKTPWCGRSARTWTPPHWASRIWLHAPPAPWPWPTDYSANSTTGSNAPPPPSS